MRRLVAILSMATLAAALFTVPVSAGTTRHGYACEEHYLTNYGGSIDFEGSVLLLRDAIYVYEVVGDPECAGTITVTVNFNLDYADWSGVLWGTSIVDLAAVDGGFVQTWTAHWLVADPLSAPADIWDGRYVGRGFGAMAGWQTRGTIHEASHVLVLDQGFAFQPGT